MLAIRAKQFVELHVGMHAAVEAVHAGRRRDEGPLEVLEAVPAVALAMGQGVQADAVQSEAGRRVTFAMAGGITKRS